MTSLQLLEKDGSLTMHHYKRDFFFVYKNLSETIFGELLDKKIHITFVEIEKFQIAGVNTVWNGSNSVRYFEPITRDLVPSERK